MSIVQLVVVIVVAGLAMWLINKYIPMQNTIRKIVNAVAVVFIILYVLSAFGVIGNIQGVRIPR